MDLSLQQIQKLSPQMLQSLKVLQLSAGELEKLVQTEIQNNPLLDIEIPEYFSNFSPKNRPSNSELNPENLLENVAADLSLREYLLQQVPDLPEHAKQDLEEVIGHLDENGFLADPEISQKYPSSYKLLRQLEPKGIGARDLQDCLLTQIPPATTLFTLIQNHFDDLQHYRYSKIQRALNISRSELLILIKKLHQYHFYPAKIFNSSAGNIIIPEIFFEKTNGIWSTFVRNQPQIKFSGLYSSSFTKKLSATDRDFFRYHRQRAKNLMHSILQRSSTLQRIAELILKNQKEFLEYGPAKLRPLSLKDASQLLQLNPSTVSRAISQKYAQIPHGILPIKYFFSNGIGGISQNGIKQMIEEIIGNEDKKSPLCDKMIAQILNEKGIFISRRTVTKYRQQLKILHARTRKIV